jgi:hypothetical protein
MTGACGGVVFLATLAIASRLARRRWLREHAHAPAPAAKPVSGRVS